MIKLEDLIEAVDEAYKGKRKSKETIKYMLNKEINTIMLLNDINNRTYSSNGNYAFVVTIPKPREIFATEFRNRVVHHYLYKRIMPLIDKKVPYRTFSNRKGLGGDKAIQQLRYDIYEMSNGFTSDCYIMKIDIKGYFPNANWYLAYLKMYNLVKSEYIGEDKEDVLYLLKQCLYANPASNCEKRGDVTIWRFIEPSKSLFNKTYGTGAAIGWLIWQITMLYYLVDLDLFLYKNKNIRYCRFVDDIVIIGKDKKELLSLMPEIRKIIINNGCTLNEKKFYFQHYSKGVEFLGSHIKFDRIYLNNKTIHRALCKIRFLNNIIDKNKYKYKFQQSMNSYFGLLKQRTDFKIIIRLIFVYIDSEWWHYVKFNLKRRCIQIRKQYKQF